MTALYSGDDPTLILGRRIRRLQTAFPEMANDPKSLMAMAQSPGDDNAMLDQAATAVTVQGFKTRLDGLRQLSEGDQRSEWKSYDVRAQAALSRLGYRPPKKQSWTKMNLPNLPNLPKIGGIDLPNLPDLPTIGGNPVTTPVQALSQVARHAGGATMDAMQAGSDAMQQGYRAVKTMGLPELKLSGPDRFGRPQINADADALKLDVANAALGRAVADGTLTQSRAARLRTNPKSTLEWFDNLDDPDVPTGYDTYRAYSGSWADAWKGAKKGERQFTPKAELDARNMLSDDEGAIFLAKRTAAGETVASILADEQIAPSTPEYYARATELYDQMKAPKFDEAVKRLRAEKISPGGDLRRGMGLSSTSTIGRVTESGMNIASMFVLDPTLVGGKAFSAARVAHKALTAVDLAEELNTYRKVLDGTHVARTGVLGAVAEADLQYRVGNVRRGLGKIVEAYTAGTPQAMEKLVREMPGVTQGLTYLTEYHNAIPLVDELTAFNAITDGAGLATLASGRLGRVSATGGIELVQLTRTEQAAAHVSAKWKDAVDWASDFTPGTIDNLIHGRPIKAAQSAVGNVGRLLASGGLQPIRPYMNLDDAEEVRKAIRGMSLLGVSSERRAQLFTDFVLASNSAGRSEVMAAISNDMLKHAGIYEALGSNNEKVVKAAQSVLDRVNLKQHSVGGIDLHLGSDGVERSVGAIAGTDFSYNRQLPEFRELIRAGNQGAFMAKAYRFTNPTWMEAFMSKVWKPAVLLRASFVPRAAGEEMLTYVLRHGGVDLAETFGSKSLAKQFLAGYAKGQKSALPGIIDAARVAGTSAEDIAKLEAKATQAIADFEKFRYSTGTHSILKLTDKLAEKVPLSRPLDRAAHLVAGLATDAVRAGAGTLANPEYVDAAKALLAHEDYAYAHYADLVAGTRAAMNPLDEIVQVQRDGSLVVVGMTQKRSAFEEVALRGNSGQDAAYVNRLDRLHDNPLAKTWIQTAATRISDSSEAQLLTWAKDTRFAGKNGAETVRNIRTELSALSELHPDLTNALERWAMSGTAPTGVEAGIQSLATKARETGALADRTAAKAAATARRTEATDWTAVGKEQLDMFMEPGRASRSIENRLLTRAIEKDPSLRDALVVGENGKIKIDRSVIPEDLLKSIRAEAADGAKAFEELHKAITGVNQRERAIIYGSANVQSGQMGYFHSDARKKIAKTLGSEEGAAWLTEGDRMAGVAVPPKTGEMGMYFPVFEPEVVQALNVAANNPQVMTDILSNLGDYDRKILDSYFQMLDPQMADLKADTLSRWASGSHIHAEEVGRAVHKALGLEVPKDGVQLVIRDVATPKGTAQGKFVRGQTFRGFTPADSEATLMGRVAGADVYSLPDHVLTSGQRLVPGVGQTMVDGVVRPGVTREQAIEQWAKVIDDEFTSLMMSEPNGEVLHEILTPMLDERGGNLLHHVKSIPGTELPKSIVVPIVTVSADPKTVWKTIVNAGFNKMIGPAISSLAREPLWIHNYAEGTRIGRQIAGPLRASIPEIRISHAVAANAGLDPEELRSVWHNVLRPDSPTRTSPQKLRDAVAIEMGVDLTPQQAKALRDGLAAEQHVDRLVSAAATERALNQSIPYIDDHQVRSFFSEYARGFTPFLYAQEQFLKRWMRTVRHSPEALHRAQLYVGALRSVGFVHADPNTGDDQFVLPLTGASSWLFSNTPVISNLLGTKGSFPTPMHLTGSVKNLVSGAGDPFGISPAPIFQAGAGLARSLFPELATDPYDAIYGEKPQRGKVEQWMPAWAATAYKTFADEGGDGELSRVALMSVQVLAAEGARKRIQAANETDPKKATKLREQADELDPPDGTPDNKIEDWKHRVTATARSMMLTRAIFQFGAPTAGRLTQNIALSDEFRQYLATSDDFQEAFGRFKADYPFGEAFTVPTTESVSGARANYTEAADKWLADNAELAKKNPKAAPWLMPPGSPGDDSYAPRAYYNQVAYKWRNRKDLESWRDDLRTAAASSEYQANKDKFDATIAALPEGDPRRVAVRTKWSQWSAIYAAQNPVFWRVRNSRDARDRRDAVRRQIMEVADAGELPKGDSASYAQGVAALVSNYNQTVAVVLDLGAAKTNVNTAKKKRVREKFITWADTVMAQQPELRSLYDSVIAPDADWISEEN